MENNNKKNIEITPNIIEVSIISETNLTPLKSISHAAKTCYNSAIPKIDSDPLDVENQLAKTGHHTTMEHYFITYSIDGISIGDITFGLHLTSPFYNSDQRSGRYCKKMFSEPNLEEIIQYIDGFWEIENGAKEKIYKYLDKCVKIYQDNIGKGTESAEKLLKAERPYISEDNLKSSSKIAQEQLRVFFPVIFPTGLDITLDLTALASLYYSAWNPVMRHITDRMKELFLEKHPEMKFLFDIEKRNNNDWSLNILSTDAEIKYNPSALLLSIGNPELFISPKSSDMHPFDKLHFLPEYMNNNIGNVESEIEVSVATMGQDQRHRTIRRGEPKFTGNFYLPPIAKDLNLENIAREIINDWISLKNIIPETLWAILAPYGAMVSYKKSGSFNAVTHECQKRLCWCAQEEIYNISRQLREQFVDKLGFDNKLLSILEPPCYKTGICTEGKRYCGRDMKLRQSEDYFPIRKV